jgi:uncharacterized protein YuzB (UPF0349 family)
MSLTVECCIDNVERSERRELDAVSGVKLVQKPCLHRCGDCARGRYTVIDGEFSEIADDRTLLEEVLGEA